MLTEMEKKYIPQKERGDRTSDSIFVYIYDLESARILGHTYVALFLL